MSSVVMIIIIFYLFILALAIAAIAANYKCFQKAGIPGWKAIIPFYNSYLYSMIGTNNIGLSLGYAVLSACYSGLSLYMRYTGSADYTGYLLLGLPMLILGAVINFRFAKAFGQSDGFAVAYIFLAGILILAFAFSDDVKYSGPLADNNKNTFTYQNTSDNYTFSYSESDDNINTPRNTETISDTIRKDPTLSPVQPDTENKPDQWDWFFK